MTKEIEAALEQHPLYSQDGKGGKALVLAKFFLPGTSWTWYILEGSRIDLDEDTATGSCRCWTRVRATPPRAALVIGRRR